MIKFNKKFSKKVENIIAKVTSGYALNVTVDQINDELKIKFQNPNAGFPFADKPMPGTMDAISEFWKISENIIAKLEKIGYEITGSDFFDSHVEDFILTLKVNF